MKEIKALSDPQDKVQCLTLVCEMLKKENQILQLHSEIAEIRKALAKKCIEIETKAGEGYHINEEFDCVKEGVSYGNNNDN